MSRAPGNPAVGLLVWLGLAVGGMTLIAGAAALLWALVEVIT
ncbi:hypothetical protein [Phytoactinopolyspora alkaliphila]|nr:hypothetical protein [Phytoactinopolyspora alkaliphila]